MGYLSADLIGNNPLELIHWKDQERANTIFNSNHEENNDIVKLRIKDQRNKYFLYEFKRKIFLDQNGDLKFLIITKNVNKQEDLKEKLNGAEEKFQWITENTNDLIRILNDRSKIEYLNESAHLKTLGYTSEDLFGSFTSKLRHPDEKTEGIKFVRQIADKGEAFREGRLRHKDGHYVWFDIRAKRFKDSKGNWKGLGIAREITDRKNTEQRLKESEEMFRTIAEQWLMGICIIQDNRIKYLNQQLADSLGYTTEEILSWQPGEFFKTIHPEDRQMVIEQAELRDDEFPSGIRNYIVRGIHKNGQVLWVEVWFKAIEYKGRRAFLNTFIDITDKKIAEERLRESEERYRLITESANDLIRVLNDNFEFEYINENVHKRLLGYDKEDLIGQTHLPFLHPEDRRHAIRSTLKNLKRGYGSYQARFKEKNGQYKWFEFGGKIFYDSKGSKKILSIARDINERKSVEQKLKESEAKFRTAFNSSVISMSITTIEEGRIIEANNVCLNDLGFEREEVIDKTTKELDLWVDRSQRDLMLQTIKEEGKVTNKLIEYRTKEGKVKCGLFSVNIINLNGKPYLLNVVNDITDRIVNEQKLKESEKKYRHLFNNSPFFIGLVDMNGNLIDCNMTINEFMSFHSRENVVGKSFREILSLNEKNRYLIPIFSKLFKEAIKGNKVDPYEFELFRSRDENLWLHIEGTLIELNNKKVLQFIIQNITERKRAEIALQQAVNHWSTTFNAMSDSVILLDQDNRIIQCNRATLEILGKSNYQQIIGRTCWDVVYGTSTPVDWCPVMFMKKSGQTESSIAQIGDKWLRFSANPILNDKNCIIGAVHVISDITEQKLAEEKYKDLVNSISDLLLEVDLKGKFTYASPQLYDIFGFTFEEIRGKRIHKFIHPKDLPRVAKVLKESYDTKKNLTVEYRTLHKDGHYVYCSARGAYMENGRFYGVVRDISERKLAEIKLKESEKRYRLITDNSKESVFIMDMNLKQTFASPASYDMLGYSPEELKGLSIQKTTTPESIKIIAEIFKEELAIEKQADKDLTRSRRFEIQQIHKNGKIIDVEVSATFLRDDDNTAIGIIGLSRDISARKKAERKLQESEERYRFLFEKSPFIIILLNSKGIIVDCNSKVEDFGYVREELIGRKYFIQNIIDQKFIPILLERLRRILEGEPLPPIDVELIKKDGSKFWGSINSSLINIAGTIYIQTLIEDCTSRIEAEQKLSASEERLRLITENANDVIWTVDMNLSFTYISPTCLKVLGYTDKETLDLGFQKFTTPNSIKILIEAFKEELELEKRGTENQDRVRKIEIQQIHKNGTIVDVELILTWLRDENEKAIGIIGITRDVSERKEAERKLKESEERYRLLSENANDVIWTTDMNLNLTYVSPSTQNASGYTVEEMLNMKIDQYHTPTSCKFLVEQFKEELKIERRKDKDLNRIRVFEVEQIHKNGSIINKEIVVTFLRDENQKAIGVLGVTRDVTEKKEAEKKLKESEKKFRKAYKRANYYKDLFAHDINNILQTINSSAELIKYHLSESEKIRDVNAITSIIKKQVMRGAKLITNIHTLSNLEEEDIPIEPIEINNLLKNSIEFIKNVYTNKKFDTQVDSFKESITVKANYLVQDVFDNLLNNAVKYNSNENVEISIKISKKLIEEIGYIKMEFLDNGIGVADERKDLIFKRYERAHKGGKGMGVGLSLIKKIIKKYNGKIWVEDKIKGDYTKGSNFVILIPEAIRN